MKVHNQILHIQTRAMVQVVVQAKGKFKIAQYFVNSRTVFNIIQ